MVWIQGKYVEYSSSTLANPSYYPHTDGFDASQFEAIAFKIYGSNNTMICTVQTKPRQDDVGSPAIDWENLAGYQILAANFTQDAWNTLFMPLANGQGGKIRLKLEPGGGTPATVGVYMSARKK